MYRTCFSLLLLMFFVTGAMGQGVSSSFGKHDYLFPARGRMMITTTTGIPYLGIVEVGVGISDRFTVSGMLGRTPIENGYGFRVRAVLMERSASFRLVAKMPAFYYAARPGQEREAWALAWPSVHAEWQTTSGARLSLGAGLVGAACVNALLGRHAEAHADAHPGHLPTELEHGGSGAALPALGSDEFMGDIWNTISAGLAVPVGRSVSIRVDLSAVMSGAQLAGPDWIGGPPVILNIGISRTLR
jgi:hypothetical protein